MNYVELTNNQWYFRPAKLYKIQASFLIMKTPSPSASVRENMFVFLFSLMAKINKPAIPVGEDSSQVRSFERGKLSFVTSSFVASLTKQ